jgi:ABC-type branched-subunit amino acid transport system ATPase component
VKHRLRDTSESNRLWRLAAGGERRRIALRRRILVHRCPLTGDPADRTDNRFHPGGRIAEVLREINLSGLTILLVEQDVLTAFELAGHAYVLETGRISVDGETTALADDPRIRQAYLGMSCWSG